MVGAEEKAEVLKSQASNVSKEIEFLRTLKKVAQGQEKFIPEACPDLELQRGPAARIVDCDDTTSELELQRGPAARFVDCGTTIEQHALETSRLLHRDCPARTEAESAGENLMEEVGVADDNNKAMELCRQTELAIPATSEAAKAPCAAVGNDVLSRTAASTSSLKREVLMPWERSKWLAVGARPAMKATPHGSLRQVAGLKRLTGSGVSLSSARSLPTSARDGEATECNKDTPVSVPEHFNIGDENPKPKHFFIGDEPPFTRRFNSSTSLGSASSLASTVASPQRRDQFGRSPGGLTRQKNSNVLHRLTAEHRSVAGSGGGATTLRARRTRRRDCDGLLRESKSA
jgi:hypothetical protein